MSDDHDDYTPEQYLGKSSRSSSTSQTKQLLGSMPRSTWRKSKLWSTSSSKKRKHLKNNVRHGEAKWYLETISSMNTNKRNTDNENSTSSSTNSTPKVDQVKQKLGKLKRTIKLCSFLCSVII